MIQTVRGKKLTDAIMHSNKHGEGRWEESMRRNVYIKAIHKQI